MRNYAETPFGDAEGDEESNRFAQNIGMPATKDNLNEIWNHKEHKEAQSIWYCRKFGDEFGSSMFLVEVLPAVA